MNLPSTSRNTLHLQQKYRTEKTSSNILLWLNKLFNIKSLANMLSVLIENNVTLCTNKPFVFDI